MLANHGPALRSLLLLVEVVVEVTERVIGDRPGVVKRDYAVNLSMCVLDGLGVATDGLRGRLLEAAIRMGIEVVGHLFNKRGVFSHD